MRRRFGIGLIAALLLLVAFVNRPPAAELSGFAGRFDLKSLKLEGLSALWIAPDGLRLIAVSDRSFLVMATIQRDAHGSISGITVLRKTPLFGPPGRDSAAETIDSEGIAIGPDGGIYISTEGPARVLRFDNRGKNPVVKGRARDFGEQLQNGALESLAIGPDGALYTLPETESGARGPFEIFADFGQGWHLFATLPRESAFLPVSADIGPDDRLYILYRKFNALLGFSTRLQRFSMSAKGLGPPETLLHLPFGQHGNLEGLSVWRDPLNRLTASMVSDDNGNFFQNAELTEFHLDD